MADIEFRDNGTVTIPVGGQTITIRRPSAGKLFEMWDLIDEIVDQAQADLTQLLAEADNADEAEFLKKLRKERRRAYEYTTVPWLKKVCEELGSAPLPDDLSEAPSGLTDPLLAQKIIGHWRTVPLAHSGR